MEVKKGLHVLNIDSGIMLDGMRIKGVRQFQYSQKENENTGTLILKMDVRILGSSDCEDRKSILD